MAAISLLGASLAQASDSCLPLNVTEDTLISTRVPAGKFITVREALRQIDGRCRDGKLVDKSGREVYFFHLSGCWGNPPSDYQEQLAAQSQEIERLTARYTVFVVPCATTNPRASQ